MEAGVLVGITSGAVEAATHIKLAGAHLNQYFSFGGFGSDSKDRGELTRIAIGRASVVLGAALDPAHVCVLGDTRMVIAAAHAAGAVGSVWHPASTGSTSSSRRGRIMWSANLTEPLPVLVALQPT
jgi:phosphoglycolate phosphatase